MRQYKTATGWAILIYITAPLLIALAVWLIVEPLISNSEEDASSNTYWFIASMSVGLVGVMVYGLIEVVKGRFVIATDKVYYKSAFTSRQLSLDEIKGYRINENYITIEPNVKGKKKVGISTYFGKTDEIIAWLASYYPNLDALNAEQEELEILTNEELGWMTEQRERKLNKARKTAKVLNWIGGLVGVWTFFWADPYEFAIIASIVVPIVAIIALKLSNGLLRIDERNDSAYPSIFLAVLAPSMAICIRALLDFNIFSHENIWLPSLIITLTIMVILMVGHKEFKYKKAQDFFITLVIAVIFLAYSYGSIVTVNCMYDNSEPEVYNTQVLSKKVSSGKTTNYYLILAPQGSHKEIEEVSVSQDLYERVNINDAVDIYFMKGLFDIPWIIVGEELYP